jgi:SAM-dependent methyltransferase
MDYKTILLNFFRGLSRNGCRSAFSGLVRASQERLQEWRYGIKTKGVIHLEKVGLSARGRSEYGAVDYRDFRLVMAGLSIRSGQDVFLDYGAGLGRVLVLAATYPFKSVIGVELSKEFAEQATRNITACSRRLACKDVRCIVDDATTYDVADNVSHIFFNNPFYGELLDLVFERIRRSLVRNPRHLLLICDLPQGSVFETQIRAVDWLDLQAEIPLPSGRKALIFSPQTAD